MGDSDPNSAFLLTKSRVDSIESRILSQRSRIEIKDKKPLFNFGSGINIKNLNKLQVHLALSQLHLYFEL